MASLLGVRLQRVRSPHDGSKHAQPHRASWAHCVDGTLTGLLLLSTGEVVAAWPCRTIPDWDAPPGFRDYIYTCAFSLRADSTQLT